MGGAQAAVHKPPRTQGDNIASINPSARKKRPDRGCVGAAWLRRSAAIYCNLQTQKEVMTKPVLLRCYSEDRTCISQEG